MIATLVLVASLAQAGDVPPPPPPPPPAEVCTPDCRTGYVCWQGRCVSRCNPPCAAGEQCTADGQCLATLAPPGPALVVEPEPEREAAPSRGGGIAMIVTGAILLGVAGIAGGISVPFWLDGLDLEPDSSPGVSSGDVTALTIAGTFTAVALAAAITGAILVPVGVRRVRAASSAQASLFDSVRPIIAVGPHGGLFGFAVGF